MVLLAEWPVSALCLQTSYRPSRSPFKPNSDSRKAASEPGIRGHVGRRQQIFAGWLESLGRWGEHPDLMHINEAKREAL